MTTVWPIGTDCAASQNMVCGPPDNEPTWPTGQIPFITVRTRFPSLLAAAQGSDCHPQFSPLPACSPHVRHHGVVLILIESASKPRPILPPRWTPHLIPACLCSALFGEILPLAAALSCQELPSSGVIITLGERRLQVLN
jgi:hypothetical protein